VLEHVIGPNDKFVKRKSKIRRLEDHARFGLRDALLTRLEDDDPSMNELRAIIYRNVLRAIIAGEVMDENPHDSVNEVVDLMMHRLRLFDSAPLIGIRRKSTAEMWLVDRLQPLLLDGARQYGAPDIVIQNGSRLCLVRLAMELPSRAPNKAGELELGSMLLWAERNPMIQATVDDVDVVRVGWLGTRWVKWSKKATNEWAAQARSMIAMDIEAMAHLMIFDGSLDELPRSRSIWRCSRCAFNDECPGVEVRGQRRGQKRRQQDPLLA
jgi:hypothetical protein